MKIYISGISPEVTEKDLIELYSQFGKFTKVDLLKTETGENRGYAFAEFSDDMSGEAAILGTNNTLMGGQNIQVSVSRSRLDQKRARQSSPKGGGSRPLNNSRPGAPRAVNPRGNPRNPKWNNGNSNRVNNNAHYPQPRKIFNSPEEDRYNHPNGPEKSNTSYPEDRYNNKDMQSGSSAPYEPNYNNYNNRRGNNNSFQKGIDYGRKESYKPQMSFLGQEGFGAQPEPDNYSSPNTSYHPGNNNSSPRTYNRGNNYPRNNREGFKPRRFGNNIKPHAESNYNTLPTTPPVNDRDNESL